MLDHFLDKHHRALFSYLLVAPGAALSVVMCRLCSSVSNDLQELVYLMCCVSWWCFYGVAGWTSVARQEQETPVHVRKHQVCTVANNIH